MQDIIISKATEPEAETLTKIAWRTYLETYADCRNKAYMLAYFNENFSIQPTARQLQDPNCQFLIAWDKDRPIGYLKANISEAQTQFKESDSLQIERIYLLAAYQRKKIGQLLCQKAIEIAKEKHKTSIWLSVWEKNPKAIHFFQHNGFVKFDEQFFAVANEQQSDQLMRKVL